MKPLMMMLALGCFGFVLWSGWNYVLFLRSEGRNCLGEVKTLLQIIFFH